MLSCGAFERGNNPYIELTMEPFDDDDDDDD